jgi:hypothetical protein
MIETMQHCARQPHRPAPPDRSPFPSLLSTAPPTSNSTNIIVPMAVFVVALSVRRAIFFRRKRVRMQSVAGAHHVTPAEIGFHAAHWPPRYSAKDLRRLVHADPGQFRAACSARLQTRRFHPAPASSTPRWRCSPSSESACCNSGVSRFRCLWSYADKHLALHHSP